MCAPVALVPLSCATTSYDSHVPFLPSGKSSTRFQCTHMITSYSSIDPFEEFHLCEQAVSVPGLVDEETLYNEKSK